jgi:hypothetical protein
MPVQRNVFSAGFSKKVSTLDFCYKKTSNLSEEYKLNGWISQYFTV